jgi:hypothetical protein
MPKDFFTLDEKRASGRRKMKRHLENRHLCAGF